MGSAKIEIANNALGELGEPALMSLSEVSLRAETVNTHYDDTVEDVLSKVPWRFATQKAALSRDVAVPPNEWQYQYTLPPLFLRMVTMYPPSSFEIYGLKIYSNETALSCDYVMRVSESFFSPTFVRLVSLELAVRMCMTITGDLELKVRLQTDARLQFGAASATDAMQRPNTRFGNAPFVDCRQ